MRFTTFAIGLVLLVLSSIGFGIAQDSSNAKRSAGEEIFSKVYPVKDLAVWTEDNKFDPSILTTLIEAKFRSEENRIAVQEFYPNQSLIITGGKEKQEQISNFLDKFKKK